MKTLTILFLMCSIVHAGVLQEEAWVELKNKNFKQVFVLTDMCYAEKYEYAKNVESYIRRKNLKIKMGDFPVLDDIGECLFIKAEALKMQGKVKEVFLFKKILKQKFPHSVWNKKQEGK